VRRDAEALQQAWAQQRQRTAQDLLLLRVGLDLCYQQLVAAVLACVLRLLRQKASAAGWAEVRLMGVAWVSCCAALREEQQSCPWQQGGPGAAACSVLLLSCCLPCSQLLHLLALAWVLSP
jgi:hypothetical protein